MPPVAERRFRPALWATAFTVVAVAIMVGLGTWQVERMQWKSDLLTRIRSQMQAEPAPLPAAIDDPAAWDFRRVAVTGRFRHDQEMFLGPRTHEGRLGYHLITPLERTDGGVVLVSRGWIPYEMRDSAPRADGNPEGVVTIAGVARVPSRPGWMQPDNKPEENQWFGIDFAAMGRRIGADPVPVIVEADASANPGGLPVGGVTRLTIPNNHLQYAITWYSLAMVLVVIYIVYHRRPSSR
jgi:surfeit locus 1 family protein